ncbi:hypothetical protein HDA40_004494 [Hamadaea flava]|uniref:Lipoprotein n=1 Tax=Hamadaea flava TaxID=1742688 RepID=A0ABV8LG19_9ACTN|nr:hypothetical protein [Hamadaea flava]MCP2325987.1 hypothetical protein [Hamadaea flava]
MPRIRPLVVAATAAATLLAAGCGKPPDLREQGVPVPSPSVLAESTRPPLPQATTTPSTAPTFSESYYVACLGNPSGDQVVATLRAKTKLLPKSGTISVTMGPLCSGTWQYTIVQAPGKDALVVVTKAAATTAAPAALQIVTAGSDVCTITVRTQAPAGLLAAARCS